MSEIKDRQDAASDTDPIVAALTDDTLAAAVVEGLYGADVAIGDAGTSDDLPVAEDTAVDEADSPAAGDAADAPFDFVALEPADAVASVLPSDADPDLEGAAVVDLTLASEAMPAELATHADGAKEADATDGVEGLAYDAPPAASVPETIPFDQMTAAYADTIVEVEADSGHDQDDHNDHDNDDGPLLDGELEDGIASVFAALHAAAQHHTEDSATIAPLGDLEAAEGVTFRLLGELDRLWHRAA